MHKADYNLKKHILVISQYFYPEQFRINDICSEWVQRGYKVTVVTGIPNYPQGKFYKGYGLFKKRRYVYNGIEIVRIPLIPRGNSAIMLALNYLSFVVTGFFWKVFTKINADYVFIFEVSPMTQALPGVWFAKKRKIPCYLYVQDLWPENVEIITGLSNKKIIAAIIKMVSYVYKNCTRILATSESFVQSIHERGVSLDKIEYWPQYAEDFYVPQKALSIPEIPDDDSFNIIFAGNIGEAQGLDVLIRAAEVIKLKSKIRIRFNIVGDGRYKEKFVHTANTTGVSELFNFVPKQPASRVPAFLAACDVAFISLADSPLFTMTIPAKLQSYLACGVPIIASAAGETVKIIKEAGSGLCSAPVDADELVDNITALANLPDDELKRMGHKGLLYYQTHFDKKILLDQIDKLFA